MLIADEFQAAAGCDDLTSQLFLSAVATIDDEYLGQDFWRTVRTTAGALSLDTDETVQDVSDLVVDTLLACGGGALIATPYSPDDRYWPLGLLLGSGAAVVSDLWQQDYYTEGMVFNAIRHLGLVDADTDASVGAVFGYAPQHTQDFIQSDRAILRLCENWCAKRAGVEPTIALAAAAGLSNIHADFNWESGLIIAFMEAVTDKLDTKETVAEIVRQELGYWYPDNPGAVLTAFSAIEQGLEL